MNEKSRSVNSMLNSIIGVVVQGSGVVLSFITRLFFVHYLGEEYLGVNGLFSNILTVLALAELGVGNAISFSLYKPVAEKDESLISAYINFYKHAYRYIGLAITVIGILLIPLLPFLIKERLNIPNITLIYIIFLANTSCSYLFAYRRAIYIADQRERVLSEYRLIITIFKALIQCVILVFTRNFYLYLLAQILCTLSDNIIVQYKSNKHYPFLRQNKNQKLSKDRISKLITDIKSLMIYKIGSTVLDGTDNIILSAFVGVVWVGKLSNYTLIISSINMITSQIINSVTASVGNFIATEDSKRYETLLIRITFASYVIYSFCTVCLFSLMTPFVSLFFGSNYILDKWIVLVISINFYIFGMMGPIWMFRTTMGLFVHGKYRPLISAIMNIVISIFLANKIGLIGVLLGTTITRILTNVIYDPYIVYKYGIRKSPWKYYFYLTKCFIIMILTIIFTSLGAKYFLSFFSIVGFMQIIIILLLCVLVFTLFNFLLFYKTDEYSYFISKFFKLNKST